MASAGKPIDIRLIRPEEVGAWAESVALPFLNPIANDGDRKRLEHRTPHVDVERAWVIEDRGRFVGNAAIETRTVTLPGGPDGASPAIPLCAIAEVGVHPTHRRRGLLRRLMGIMLEDGRRRGEVVAGLTATESSIYGRFGFGWGVSGCRLKIDTRHGAFAVPAPEMEIELLVGEAAAKVVPAAFERARRYSPGQVNRPEAWWANAIEDRQEDRRGASARLWAVCDGGVAGWSVEQVRDGQDSWHRLLLRDLLAETAEIEATLWRFALDTDLVREVVAFPRPIEEPLRHRLADPRRLQTVEMTDFLWFRILDTPGALTARGYVRAGRLVLDVEAPASTPNATDGVNGPDPAVGRWTLEVGPDGSTCRPARAGDTTDLTLGVAELSAIFGGEVRATTLAGAGRVREDRPGALLDADSLFVAGRTPNSLTGF